MNIFKKKKQQEERSIYYTEDIQGILSNNIGKRLLKPLTNGFMN